MKDTIKLGYNDLVVTIDDEEFHTDYNYEVDYVDVLEYLSDCLYYGTGDGIPYDQIEDNFDEYFDAFYDDILEYFEDDAAYAASQDETVRQEFFNQKAEQKEARYW